MNTHDHHDEPLPGEDELKALYRSLPRNEPAPALDEAVRHAAAAALRTSSRRTARWPVAAASAAVLVLAAGLGWRMRDQVPGLPHAQAPSAVSGSTAAPSATEAPTILAADDRQAVPTRDATMAPATIAPYRAHESLRSALKPRVLPAAPAPAMEATAAPERVIAPSPTPAALPMPAPAATPNTAGHRMAAMKAMVVPPPTPAIDPTAANPTDTPAQELDKIRLLLTRQHRDEALQRLAAFQHAHPDVTLPDDLRAQLPDHD